MSRDDERARSAECPTGEGYLRLKAAAEEASWLVARDYPPDAVAVFVSEHRRLSADDRALCACSARLEAHARHHIARELDPEDVARRPLRIDADNVLATVEAALAGRVLVRSSAGILADPTWRRGSAGGPAAPEAALGKVVGTLRALSPASTVWLVDEASALGGWLPAALARAAKGWRAKAEVRAVPSVATKLQGAAYLASADPELLDQCATWLNLVAIGVRDVPGLALLELC